MHEAGLEVEDCAKVAHRFMNFCRGVCLEESDECHRGCARLHRFRHCLCSRTRGTQSVERCVVEGALGTRCVLRGRAHARSDRRSDHRAAHGVVREEESDPGSQAASERACFVGGISGRSDGRWSSGRRRQRAPGFPDCPAGAARAKRAKSRVNFCYPPCSARAGMYTPRHAGQGSLGMDEFPRRSLRGSGGRDASLERFDNLSVVKERPCLH